MFVDFLYIFFDDAAPSSRRLAVFSTRRKGFDFDEESMFFSTTSYTANKKS